MAVFSRRLQVLVEPSRFVHLEVLARRQRTTVAALVRRAIDTVYPPTTGSAEAALAEFLAEPDLQLEDWSQSKRTLDDALSRAERLR